MFFYMTVEEVLAKINGINQSSHLAFRGRINNLKRLGVIPSSGGRGKKLQYKIEDVWFLAFCLELAQFGVDPADIQQIANVWKKDVIQKFTSIARTGDNVDHYAVFELGFMFADMDRSEAVARFHWMPVYPDDRADRDTLRHYLGRRAAVINLTTLKRAIDESLTSATTTA